jgi:hypothetical protein
MDRRKVFGVLPRALTPASLGLGQDDREKHFVDTSSWCCEAISEAPLEGLRQQGIDFLSGFGGMSKLMP